MLVNPLDQNLFHVLIKDIPTQFNELSNFKQETEWYSLGASNVSQCFADLVLVNFVEKLGLPQLVRYAWLGSLFQA